MAIDDDHQSKLLRTPAYIIMIIKLLNNKHNQRKSILEVRLLIPTRFYVNEN